MDRKSRQKRIFTKGDKYFFKKRSTLEGVLLVPGAATVKAHKYNSKQNKTKL